MNRWFFFFQAEDGIRDKLVTGVQTCALPIFVIRGEREAGFETDTYDTGQTLVIDPVMQYSTFLGGAGSDQAYAVAVDSAGCAYVAGETWPMNFPRTFVIANSTGNQDAFLMKMNASGSAVVYATYFGGQSRDSARGVAVDSSGNASVAGFPQSPDFPTHARAHINSTP